MGRNAIQNGGYLPGTSCDMGSDVYKGIDYTYVNKASFKKKWYRWYEETIMWEDDGNDMFFVTRNRQSTFQVWFIFGYRATIEFFDENAIVDFLEPMDEPVEINAAVNRFLTLRDCPFKIERLSKNLVNIEL